MRLAQCKHLATSPLTGFWVRALKLSFLETRLSTEHTKTLTTRFSAATKDKPLYRTLYLAENQQVAVYEVGALFGPPVNPIADLSYSIPLMSLEVKLHRIANLCDGNQRRIVDVSFQELTGDWINSPDVPPRQELGQALFRVKGLEGFLYPSSRVDGKNLVIFPDKLNAKSSITFKNDGQGKIERLI